MASDFADDESRAAGPRDARSAEMRRSIDAINAVRAGRIGNPAMVDAAMMAEAALKMGAGPRSAEFARVRSRQGYDRLARMLSNVSVGFAVSAQYDDNTRNLAMCRSPVRYVHRLLPLSCMCQQRPHLGLTLSQLPSYLVFT